MEFPGYDETRGVAELRAPPLLPFPRNLSQAGFWSHKHSLFTFFRDFGATSSNAQGLLVALHLGITPSGARGEGAYGYLGSNRISCTQSKRSTIVLSLWPRKFHNLNGRQTLFSVSVGALVSSDLDLCCQQKGQKRSGAETSFGAQRGSCSPQPPATDTHTRGGAQFGHMTSRCCWGG